MRAQKQAVVVRRRKRRTTLRRVVTMGGLVAVIILVVVAIQTSAGHKKKNQTTTTTKAAATTTSTFPTPTTQALTTVPVAPTCPPAAGSSKRVVLFSHAPPHCIGATSIYDAAFTTSVGDFTVRLEAAKSYAAVNNFVFLARWQYFNGTVFHRIIQGFIVQGGDPAGTGTGGATGSGAMKYGYPGYEFTGNLPPSSCSAKKDCYATGDVAMADQGGKVSTDGSQFFIVVPGAGSQLGRSYTDFGHVIKGLNVVEKIDSYGPPASAGQTGTPTVKVYVLKVSITQVKA